jgi:hypothetical protein
MNIVPIIYSTRSEFFSKPIFYLQAELRIRGRIKTLIFFVICAL